MKDLIMDASVFTAWFLNEINSQKAVDLQDSYNLSAPETILYEVSNAIWKAKRRKQINDEDAAIFINALHDIENITYYPCRKYIKKAYALTGEINHDYIYDCIYLALSLDLDIPLVTADKNFIKKLTKTRYKKSVLYLGDL